jgi:hypothetical protein
MANIGMHDPVISMNRYMNSVNELRNHEKTLEEPAMTIWNFPKDKLGIAAEAVKMVNKIDDPIEGMLELHPEQVERFVNDIEHFDARNCQKMSKAQVDGLYFPYRNHTLNNVRAKEVYDWLKCHPQYKTNNYGLLQQRIMNHFFMQMHKPTQENDEALHFLKLQENLINEEISHRFRLRSWKAEEDDSKIPVCDSLNLESFDEDKFRTDSEDEDEEFNPTIIEPKDKPKDQLREQLKKQQPKKQPKLQLKIQPKIAKIIKD